MPNVLRRALPWIIGIALVYYVTKNPQAAGDQVQSLFMLIGSAGESFGSFVSAVSS